MTGPAAPRDAWSVQVRLALARWPLFLGGVLGVFVYYAWLLAWGPLLQAFFDDLSGARPARLDAFSLLAILAALAVVQGALMVGSTAEAVARIAFEVLMRRNLVGAALARRPGAALPGSAGEAVGRLRDDTLGISTALTYTFDPVAAVLMVAVALWVLARTNLLLTLVVVVPAVAAMLLPSVLRRRVVAVRRAARQAGADVTSLIAETFGAFSAIKGTGAEDRLAAEFAARSRRRLRAERSDAVLSQELDSASQNLALIATGVVLLLVPTVLGLGTFTVGDLALFVTYLTQLATVTGLVGTYARLYRQLQVSLDRLRPLLLGHPVGHLSRREPPLLDPVPAEEPLRELEIRGLTYVHPAGGGVRGADLTLFGGTCTVVTGPVGAGKSTLVRTLLGQLPAQGGTVRWNGTLITDLAAWFVPPRCAQSPQLPALLTATVAENVALEEADRPGVRERARAAALTAVLDADLTVLRGGIDAEVGPRGTRLSGGQA
ncbi:MAG: ABC transporter ATP-binding protein, partial [Candidatus Dormibacteraeota bacterium]|nr:ABC transporter ATP-binding protein [Candidatus Dormibacteraeota bacterium]